MEVAATTQFATCRHCGAKLAIQRTDTAIFTEILEKLTTKTDQLSEQVNNLSGLTEVAALDREWELERENYMVTTKHGGRQIPSEAGAIGSGVVLLSRCLGVFGQRRRLPSPQTCHLLALRGSSNPASRCSALSS